ncbi:MAG: hypothetical protein NVS2B17_31250 [Candidatus Velthaea sp.]
MLWRGMLLGIAILVFVAGATVGAAVNMGYMPMRADAAPFALEANLAMKAVHAVSEREMGDVRNPLPVNEANLLAGLLTYKQNCAMCHGTSDGKASNAALGFYVPAPQFATDGAEDDPEGATAWKVKHGIRFSAMPAFGKSLGEAEVWQVAMLLKHMDKLPPKVDSAWKRLPSAAVPGSHARDEHVPGMQMH